MIRSFAASQTGLKIVRVDTPASAFTFLNIFGHRAIATEADQRQPARPTIRNGLRTSRHSDSGFSESASERAGVGPVRRNAGRARGYHLHRGPARAHRDGRQSGREKRARPIPDLAEALMIALGDYDSRIDLDFQSWATAALHAQAEARALGPTCDGPQTLGGASVPEATRASGAGARILRARKTEQNRPREKDWGAWWCY